MVYHLAVVDRTTLSDILSGRKSIESRLSLIRCLPYRRISEGDTIYFKLSGGTVQATARAARVFFEEHLSPERVRTLAVQYADVLRWQPGWLERKLNSRYCTFIWLENVQAIVPVRYVQPGRAGWLLLEEPLH